MPQKGLGRSAEQNRGLGGDIRLKSGPYLVLFVLLHGGRPGSGRPRTFLENILPQERYQLVSDLYLQCFKFVLSRVLLMAYSSILLEYVLDSTYS